MALDRALAAAGLYASPDDFDVFAKHVPDEWIERAMETQLSMVELRKRRLPDVQALWLVIGMALFRNEAIHEVVARLELALPDARGREVARSAIPAARARLGTEPIEWLFRRSAGEWGTRSAEAHRWRGLGIHGIDGSSLRVADRAPSPGPAAS